MGGGQKILESGEELPPTWPLAGTTGYDFLNLVGGLAVDPAGEEPLTELHARFTDATADYHDLVGEKKHLVLRQSLAADLARVTDLAVRVCERHRRQRDHTRIDLEQALAELVACFPVYRTYFPSPVARPPTPTWLTWPSPWRKPAPAGRRRRGLESAHGPQPRGGRSVHGRPGPAP